MAAWAFARCSCCSACSCMAIETPAALSLDMPFEEKALGEWLASSANRSLWFCIDWLWLSWRRTPQSDVLGSMPSRNESTSSREIASSVTVAIAFPHSANREQRCLHRSPVK
eukprot:647999-Pleurochrysis_carterae.AAC.2